MQSRVPLAYTAARPASKPTTSRDIQHLWDLTCWLCADLMRSVPRAAIPVIATIAGAMPGTASAGTYYVHACSSYGNTASAFTSYSNADHLTPANACMQPAPAGGYRSLEINGDRTVSVLHGYGANWTAYTPSPAITIVGAYTPPNTVFAECNLSSDGFAAAYFWQGGSHGIKPVS